MAIDKRKKIIITKYKDHQKKRGCGRDQTHSKEGSSMDVNVTEVEGDG